MTGRGASFLNAARLLYHDDGTDMARTDKDDCYVDVWREADFRGEKVRIYGPGAYASLEFDQGNWGNDIGSLRVGPNAFVLPSHRRDFQDEPVAFGPDEEVPDLGQFRIDDDIESLKVIDSLKIFNRLEYNAALAPETAETDSADAASPPGPHKGKRSKGRKSKVV